MPFFKAISAPSTGSSSTTDSTSYDDYGDSYSYNDEPGNGESSSENTNGATTPEYSARRKKRNPEKGVQGGMQEEGGESPQRQEENNASAEPEEVSILEYSINPSYKKDSESLSAQAIRDVHSTFDAMTEKGYRSLFEILWYKQLPCFDVRNTTSDKNNQHGMIKYCEWKGRRLPCSALFKTSPSDRGMCCTFNVQAAEKMFQDQDYGVSIGIAVLYEMCFHLI